MTALRKASHDEEMGQLVSILIPAFNAEKWIESTIESALAQTWRRKEIIVVDDGSTDTTLQLARRFCTQGVVVATQPNRGASAARNHALSLSHGDYIQWLDADDLLAPDKIALQMQDAQPGSSSRILSASAWGEFYHDAGRSRFAPSALWQDLDPVEWLFRKLDGNLWMSIDCWLVSRKLTRMAGPWDESLSLDDDGEYFSRVIRCSLAVRFVPEARSLCRRGTLGLSNTLTLTEAKLRSLATSVIAHVRLLRSMEDSPRTRGACMKMLEQWSVHFYPDKQDIWKELQAEAAEIGRDLGVPRLRKKYQWLSSILGWRLARDAQFALPALKGRVEQGWERLVSR